MNAPDGLGQTADSGSAEGRTWRSVFVPRPRPYLRAREQGSLGGCARYYQLMRRFFADRAQFP